MESMMDGEDCDDTDMMVAQAKAMRQLALDHLIYMFFKSIYICMYVCMYCTVYIY